MPQTDVVSLSGALVKCTADQAKLANSVLHLFKAPFLPSPTSTKADFLAQEADFDGYAAVTIPTWAAPILFSSGWATVAPTQIFRFSHVSADVGNAIGGYFLILSTGELWGYGTFSPAQNVMGPGQACVTSPTAVEQAQGF